MPKKARPKSPSPEVYQVEVITAVRVNDDGEWEYHVKWAGYPESDNSWEPQDNVSECSRLLKSFWDHIGIDNNDYPIGYYVAAKPYWINKEKKLFAKEFAFQLDAESTKRAAEDASKQLQKQKNAQPQSHQSAALSSIGKAKLKLSTKTLEPVDISDDSDDTPLLKKIKASASSKSREHSRKRVRSVVSDDLEDDSERPPKQTKNDALSSIIPVIHATSELSTVQVQSNVPELTSSPNSLFSQDSPMQPQLSPPRTSSKPKPKIKMLELPQASSSGSILSTKQRIAQKVSSETPTESTKKSSFANLSFKKKPLPRPPRVGGTINTSIESPTIPTFTMGDPKDITASPTSYQEMQNNIPRSLPQPQSQFDLPLQESLYASPPPLTPHVDLHYPTSTEAAEQFLTEMFPPPPMPMDFVEPEPEPHTEDPIVPYLMLNRNLSTVNKIPKKWKWTGGLSADTESDQTESICSIAISDATDPPLSGMRLSILLSSVKTIHIKKRHSIGELEVFLPSCGPVQQVARLWTENNDDEGVLHSLVSLMHRYQQATIFPLHLDGVEVANLVIFPSTIQVLCLRFRVPVELQHSKSFLVAVIPWNINSSDVSTVSIRKNGLVNTQTVPHICFPDTLREYMSLPNRTYCAWWSFEGGAEELSGLETKQLHGIMKACKAKNVGHKKDARVVFVHVGALQTLHQLPAFAERRCRRPEIHFYTYGTHMSVPRGRWGVHPIYPLGGIVTFTPEVLLQDPLRVVQLIQKIYQHPFWASYLLPSAVGMAARQESGSRDLLLEFTTLSVHILLNLVTEGKISLIEAPPLHGKDPARNWSSSELRSVTLNAHELLERCLASFAARFSNISSSQLSAAMEAEISADLLRMQTQPNLINNYRRYVIVTAASQVESNRDGFEWTTLSKFDFKDSFPLRFK